MRVFSVPVSAPFLRTVIAALVDGRLVDGFEARTDPARLAQATLYLPTRRAGRLAREIFLDVLGNGRGDPAAHRRARRHRRGRAGLRGGLRARRHRPARHSAQTRRARAPAGAGETGRAPGPSARCCSPLVVGGPASTLALAGDLARLIDDMVTRGVDWSALDGLVPDQFDEYWQLHAGIPADRARVLAGISRAKPTGSSRRRAATC